MSLWQELKRRSVVKVTIAYLAAAWLLVQVAAIVLPTFGFPEWAMRTVLAAAAIGFPVTVALAWIYDFTPEGIRRTDDLAAIERRAANGRKLDFAIIGTLSLALIAVVFDRYLIGESGGTIDTFLAESMVELVSDFPGSHSDPTLSPDGSMIAFVSDASGSRQIWVKDLARGAPIQITDGEFDALSPAWSPQNDQILFESRTEGPIPSIFSVGPLGSPPPRLLVERGLAPSFEADGLRFVYAVGREIWIADADGGNRRRVEGVPQTAGFAAREPALSPDGSLVAFVHGQFGPFGDIWIVPADGGEAQRMTWHNDRAAVAGSPSWTADGRYILYQAGAFGDRHLWRVALDTGEARQLTTGTGGYDSPSMSTDGETLTYTNHRTVWKLMHTDTATGIHEEIYESRNPIVLPHVSPGTAEIVFFTQIGTGVHVFTIGSDGEDLRQVTVDADGINTLPTWSDSGDWIYYHRATSLHRIPAAGGPSVEVLPDFHWSSRNWLAVHGNRIAYREFGITPGVARTVVKDLDSGAETELPQPSVSGLDWSRDGSLLLGTLPGLRIVVCDIETVKCVQLMGPDGPILGERPQWSSDESRIFLQRGSFGRANYRTLWAVDRDGSNLTRLFEFGPVEPDEFLTGIDDDDALVWNQTDRGSDEIWVARRGR